MPFPLPFFFLNLVFAFLSKAYYVTFHGNSLLLLSFTRSSIYSFYFYFFIITST